MLDRLSKDDFARNLNTTFECSIAPGQSVSLQLIQLREGKSSPQQEQFALLFRGPLELLLPQQMYPIRHEALGEFDLFIVPVGKDAQGFHYEAMFNRLLS